MWSKASLSGIVDPIRYIETDDYVENKIVDESKKLTNSVILIFISATIFVTVISVFDIIRNAIRMYFSDRTINNGDSNYSEEFIVREKVIIRNEFYAHLTFSLITCLLAIIIVYCLIKLYTFN